MPKWLTNIEARKWLINLTFAYFVFYSIDSIGTAFVSVMMDSEWSTLTGTQRWIRVALILKAWGSSMAALITNTQRRIQNDEPFTTPSGTSDTQMITKTDVSTTTKVG